MAPESLFIDIMMNVPLIFYAAAASGDRRLDRLARAHCDTTRATLVRADGSTAHEGIFDPEYRRVSAAVDSSGTASRLDLVPRSGLVALRFREGLCFHWT